MIASEGDTLSTLETLRLGAAQAYYSVSRALRLNKVTALLQRAELSVDSPVFLLGRCYDPTTVSSTSSPQGPEDFSNREALSDLALHFHSTLWMTYRSGFMPLGSGEVQLKSDAGWGCTLRVAQMLLAEALRRQILGEEWRWPEPSQSISAPGAATAFPGDSEPPEELARLLQLFWDVPVGRSPFSVHNLCKHGAPCGVFPGRWLGPWTACCALEAAARHASPSLLGGLQVVVLGGTGGGAPLLYTEKFMTYFRPTGTGSGENGVGQQPSGDNGHKGDEGDNDAMEKATGLLLLIPLVLGLGKLNSVYAPQLRAVLGMPQSVGFIGGSPGSSLYIVGCQENAALYLDPHEVQPAACSDGDCGTFRGDTLRTLPLLSVDPSMALGFYCKDADAYQDLCARLKRLEEEHGSAPVVCVRAGADPGPENYAGTEVGWASDVDSSDASGLSDEDDVAHEPKQAEHVPSPIQVEPAAPGPSTAPLAAVKHAAVAEENGETDSSLEEKGGGGSGGSGLKDTPLEEGGAEGSTGIKEPGDDDSSNERVEAPETSASEEDSRPGHGHVEENSMDAIAAREASLSQRSLSSAKSAAWEFL